MAGATRLTLLTLAVNEVLAVLHAPILGLVDAATILRAQVDCDLDVVVAALTLYLERRRLDALLLVAEVLFLADGDLAAILLVERVTAVRAQGRLRLELACSLEADPRSEHAILSRDVIADTPLGTVLVLVAGQTVPLLRIPVVRTLLVEHIALVDRAWVAIIAVEVLAAHRETDARVVALAYGIAVGEAHLAGLRGLVLAVAP